ncbi:unnamed protein product [Polarella glacialis]|uniref:Uncharacterized protein n=1 Tax=Polarella glacialis TaxID=89957 RepID=A0A813DDC0_POLGL|nr:unnamed protein product [Polarella glacialis]
MFQGRLHCRRHAGPRIHALIYDLCCLLLAKAPSRKACTVYTWSIHSDRTNASVLLLESGLPPNQKELRLLLEKAIAEGTPTCKQHQSCATITALEDTSIA